MNFSNFIGHTVLIICRCEQNVLLNKSLKFRFINRATAKVKLVWNFVLRIFSVYGHGARVSLCCMGPESRCVADFGRLFSDLFYEVAVTTRGDLWPGILGRLLHHRVICFTSVVWTSRVIKNPANIQHYEFDLIQYLFMFCYESISCLIWNTNFQCQQNMAERQKPSPSSYVTALSLILWLIKYSWRID